MTTTRHLVATSLAVASALAAAAAACGGDAPMTSAALAADGGLDGLAQGAGDGDTTDGPDDGGLASDVKGSALYRRLGGHAHLRSLLDGVLQAELGDPQISTYFSNQTTVPTPIGHPTLDQLSECMTDQLGSVIGGSETYPTVVNESGGTFFCRNVIPTHMFMDISGGTFDKFLMIAASALQAHGVSKADIGAIGNALSASRDQIVDPLFAEAGVRSADAASKL